MNRAFLNTQEITSVRKKPMEKAMHIKYVEANNFFKRWFWKWVLGRDEFDGFYDSKERYFDSVNSFEANPFLYIDTKGGYDYSDADVYTYPVIEFTMSDSCKHYLPFRNMKELNEAMTEIVSANSIKLLNLSDYGEYKFETS